MRNDVPRNRLKKVVCPNCGSELEEDPLGIVKLSRLETLALVAMSTLVFLLLYSISKSVFWLPRHEADIFGKVMVVVIAYSFAFSISYYITLVFGMKDMRQNGITVHYARCSCCYTQLRLVYPYGDLPPWGEEGLDSMESEVEHETTIY